MIRFIRFGTCAPWKRVMEIEVIILPNVEGRDKIESWLEQYIKAMGADVSTIVLEEDMDTDFLKREFDSHDGIIVVGAAGNISEVKKIADVLGLELEVNEEALNNLKAYYMDTLDVPENLDEMATIPEFSYPIPNVRGPVAGFVALSLEDDRFIAATPSSFSETIEVFETGIQDFIREKTGKRYSVTFSIQLETTVNKAGEIAKRVEKIFNEVFVRLDGRFTNAGIPLVCTVFASDPEELSMIHEKLNNYIREITEKSGIRVIEKKNNRDDWGSELF